MDFGISNSNFQEAEAKRQAIESSEQVFLIFTYSYLFLFVIIYLGSFVYGRLCGRADSR